MWPESLECSKFPEDSSEEICISPNGKMKWFINIGIFNPSCVVVSSSSTSKNQNTYSTPVPRNKNRINNHGFVDYKNNQNNISNGFSPRTIGFICPVQLKAPPVMGYELNVGGKVQYFKY